MAASNLTWHDTFTLISNATEINPDGVSCVYPISGQYGLMNRILLYVLIIFVLIWRQSVWLVAGALGYIMTYSGSAAIHSIILFFVTKGKQVDLDIYGAQMVVVPCMFTSSHSGIQSKTLVAHYFMPIVLFWMTILTLGHIAALTNLWTWKYHVSPPCYSSQNLLVLDSRNSSLLLEQNCHYPCLDTRQALRSSAELILFRSRRLLLDSTVFSNYDTIGGFRGVFSAFIAVRNVLSIATSLAIEIQLFKTRRKGKLTAGTLCPGCGRIETPSIEGTTEVWCYDCEHERKGGRLIGFILLALAVVFVGLDEAFLLQEGGLPTAENASAVGQWSTWVSFTLALIAAILHSYMKMLAKSAQADNSASIALVDVENPSTSQNSLPGALVDAEDSLPPTAIAPRRRSSW